MKTTRVLMSFFFASTFFANTTAQTVFNSPGASAQDEIPNTSPKFLPPQQQVPSTNQTNNSCDKSDISSQQNNSTPNVKTYNFND